MNQFLADNIDQLDLALDQLAVRERNFDRFALMLVDNVVELTLHRHAQDKAAESDMWRGVRESKIDPKLVASGLSQHFDAKVRLARGSGMLPDALADSVLYLHSFRNTAYHQGLRHERILHSLALFYFECACSVLERYSPRFWGWSSTDKISHRAMKYLGNLDLGKHREQFSGAYKRLGEIAASMGATWLVTWQRIWVRRSMRLINRSHFLRKPLPLQHRECRRSLIVKRGHYFFQMKGSNFVTTASARKRPLTA
jgi:hypothetical protein